MGYFEEPPDNPEALICIKLMELILKLPSPHKLLCLLVIAKSLSFVFQVMGKKQKLADSDIAEEKEFQRREKETDEFVLSTDYDLFPGECSEDELFSQRLGSPSTRASTAGKSKKGDLVGYTIPKKKPEPKKSSPKERSPSPSRSKKHRKRSGSGPRRDRTSSRRRRPDSPVAPRVTRSGYRKRRKTSGGREAT